MERLTLEQVEGAPETDSLWVINNSLAWINATGRSAIQPADIHLVIPMEPRLPTDEEIRAQVVQLVEEWHDKLNALVATREAERDAARRAKRKMPPKLDVSESLPDVHDVLRIIEEVRDDLMRQLSERTFSVKIPFSPDGCPVNLLAGRASTRSAIVRSTGFRKALHNGMLVVVSDATARKILTNYTDTSQGEYAARTKIFDLHRDRDGARIESNNPFGLTVKDYTREVHSAVENKVNIAVLIADLAKVVRDSLVRLFT